MPADHPSPPHPTGSRPWPEVAVAAAPTAPRDADWDEILLTAFWSRHWNLGCG